jgi:Uma2 family endonuclease
MSAQPERHLFTVDEYERMGMVGLFGEDDRVELIEGEIVGMAPIGSRHAACVARLTRLFSAAVGNRALVWIQNPIRLGTRSEPQPDVALLVPRADFYARGYPGAADILLVVEVADTSAAWDREGKARLYAAGGVGEAWVVDLAEGCVHVFTGPGPGGYADARQAVAGDSLTPGGLDGVTVAVNDILGPA